jgi:alpha-mannosidase
MALVVIRDTGSTWGHGVIAYRDEIGRPKPVSVEIVESGPILTVTRQKWRWQSSEIWMDVVRCAHTPAVELRFRINWQERRQLLKLELPTRLGDVAVHAKMPGEVVRREMVGNEEPCQDWVALSGRVDGGDATLALIHQASHSYSVHDGILRQILVRGVPHAEHPPFGYSDDANVAFLDQGWQERSFLLVAGSGPWQGLRLDRQAAEFLTPAEAMLDSGHPGTEPWERSSLTVEPANVAVLAVKPAEDRNGIILRVQEMTGVATPLRGEWQGQPFSFPLAPWQIKSLRLTLANDVLAAMEVDALEQPTGK